MRVVATMPFKDEAPRYLHSAICNALEWADDLFAFDDGSSDDSYDVALDAGAIVCARSSDTPSFLEHEGKFRQAAYEAMIECLNPDRNTWIFAVDADECVVAEGNIRDAIERNIVLAEHSGAASLVIPVPEFFGIATDGTPLQRIDGEWGKIAGTRLFRYHPGGRFSDKAMGSGAEPAYVATHHRIPSTGLWLCHYGYADARDQAAKYARYSGLANHGHLNSHVESIVGQQTLVRWNGRVPAMFRGEGHDVQD